MFRLLLVIASCFGLTGVGMGAFAAHGLRQQLSESALAVLQTGVLYQLLHAVALLGLAIACALFSSLWLRIAAGLISVGVLLFSGSLYLLVLTPLKLGLVTPLGGLCLMLGWLCIAISSYQWVRKKTPAEQC